MRLGRGLWVFLLSKSTDLAQEQGRGVTNSSSAPLRSTLPQGCPQKLVISLCPSGQCRFSSLALATSQEQPLSRCMPSATSQHQASICHHQHIPPCEQRMLQPRQDTCTRLQHQSTPGCLDPAVGPAGKAICFSLEKPLLP